jgi:tetratricopeptide (TPR) repeat protein
LIVGLIWFAGSKLNNGGRETGLVTPIPTPTKSRLSLDAVFYNHLGIAMYERLDDDGAISDYNEAIRVDPNYGQAYYNRGLTNHIQGKDAQAQADFDKAKQLGYTGPQ